MVLSSDEGLHISCAQKDGEKTGKGDVIEKEFLRVEWVETE